MDILLSYEATPTKGSMSKEVAEVVAAMPMAELCKALQAEKRYTRRQARQVAVALKEEAEKKLLTASEKKRIKTQTAEHRVSRSYENSGRLFGSLARP